MSKNLDAAVDGIYPRGLNWRGYHTFRDEKKDLEGSKETRKIHRGSAGKRDHT
jgi:hypothetical protein